MQTQRPLNSQGIPRDGAPKNVAPDTIPISPGTLKHVTAPSHDFLHGAPPVQDEPNIPLAREQPIKIHPGMTDAQRAKIHPIANSPTEILADASRLGKPQRA